LVNPEGLVSDDELTKTYVEIVEWGKSQNRSLIKKYSNWDMTE
jgi:hypothetical protein